MKDYDYALENLSLRVQRDHFGAKLRFEFGEDENGVGWCESFFLWWSIDKVFHAGGVDAAKAMICQQPIDRLVYRQYSLASREWVEKNRGNITTGNILIR